MQVLNPLKVTTFFVLAILAEKLSLSIAECPLYDCPTVAFLFVKTQVVRRYLERTEKQQDNWGLILDL